MRIKCQHGYFSFYEYKLGQISDFMSYTGLSLVPKNDYFTFEFLEDAPDFSIAGLNYLNLPALETFAGSIPEVFEANGFVYDFDADLLKPVSSVTTTATILKAGNRFVSQGLIMPGTLTDGGQRVKDYSAWFSRDRYSFKYSEVTYV